jgi:hypothetical protein
MMRLFTLPRMIGTTLAFGNLRLAKGPAKTDG